MNESLEDVDTEVFGGSNFDDVSNPLSLEELGENEHHIADFYRRQPVAPRPERIISKREYTLPEGTALKFPYKSLADIVLGGNKDVKFHRSLTSRANAQKYADNNRLTLGPDLDFNADGVNDVVLFDRYHNPVVINGFALANSEYPYKKAFYEANPKRSDQIRAGGYRKWLKDYIPDHEADISAWIGKGFKKKSISKKEPSFRDNLNTGIKDKIVTMLERAGLPKGVVSLIRSLIPWFQIFSILYDNFITDKLVDMFPDIRAASADITDFKKYLNRKAVKQAVNTVMSGAQFEQFVLNTVLSDATLSGLLNSLCGASGLAGFLRTLQTQFWSKNVYPDAVQRQLWKEEFAERAEAIKQSVLDRLNRKFQAA